MRSNAPGASSSHLEGSLGSDASGSSCDNPVVAAAAAAAAAELGPDAAEGVMLLHHMRRQRSHAPAGSAGRAAPELSCQASGVAGGGRHPSVDKSAAGILMSLSGSHCSMGD